MDEACPKLRPYDGWWYKSVPEVQASSKSKEGEKLVTATWVPFTALDNDRLERGLIDKGFREFPGEAVVHDEFGQRMCKVSYEKMTISPLYWEGFVAPVRRAIWIQMKCTDDAQGGVPVPPEWDLIIEAAYQETLPWINLRAADSTVEKIVALTGALSKYVLVFRLCDPDHATLTTKKCLEEGPLLFDKDESFRLIRGYVPYHITVIRAVCEADIDQGGTSKSKTSSAKPILLPSPFEPTLLETIIPPNDLIFSVHGIGQKFAGRLGTNFINDCELLRGGLCEAVAQRGGNVESLLLLPVNWRTDLKMGIKSYFADDQAEAQELEAEESFEELVKRITLENIPAVRDVASDVGLDILLYMTPAYFKRIIRKALSEIHRQYAIFLRSYGEGARTTRISFIGHSLGAAIVADLISFIPKDNNQHSWRCPAQATIENLGFPVDKFFALGSPLSMFFLLKQLKPKSCMDNIHEIYLERCSIEDGRAGEQYPSIPDPEDDSELRPKNVVFACKELYNIFHPCDPIAYRIEPLIVPPKDMELFKLPVKLPYNKVLLLLHTWL